MKIKVNRFFKHIGHHFSFLLVAIAVAGMLLSQPGLIWHALEHVTIARHVSLSDTNISRSGDSTEKYSIEKYSAEIFSTSPQNGGEKLCIKCFDGSANNTVISSKAFHVVLVNLQVRQETLCHRRLHVALWFHFHQRGPPRHLV